jgi:hypothetical protein
MIMSALLTEETPAEPTWAGFLKNIQETLSALLARRLRRREAELLVLHDRMLAKYWPRSQRDGRHTGAHKLRAAAALARISRD